MPTSDVSTVDNGNYELETKHPKQNICAFWEHVYGFYTSLLDSEKMEKSYRIHIVDSILKHNHVRSYHDRRLRMENIS